MHAGALHPADAEIVRVQELDDGDAEDVFITHALRHRHLRQAAEQRVQPLRVVALNRRASEKKFMICLCRSGYFSKVMALGKASTSMSFGKKDVIGAIFSPLRRHSRWQSIPDCTAAE
jgi:hypothetical protein